MEQPQSPGTEQPTMVDQILPPCSTRAENNIGDSDVSPPTYTVPTHFYIGSKRTLKPLVNISQVKGHLTLLHAFADLKKQVEELQEPIPHMPSDLEKRWDWFVVMAVERFDIWCQGLQSSDTGKFLEVTLPPIDVMMVWHAYMLNPMWYREDCMRLPDCQALKVLGTHFATALDGSLQSILSTPPSQSRIDFWLTRTALPFDHVQSSFKLINKMIDCPRCRAHIVVDMMTPDGSGYLQQKFKASCPQGCPIEITKETLTLRRLAHDLASGSESSLAGTTSLSNISYLSAPAIGEEIKRHIRINAKVFIPNSQPPEYDEKSCVDIMKYTGSSLSTLKSHIFQSGVSRRITARILSAYTDDKAYSVELVGTVLRQGSFVQKMYQFGWTGPGFFDDVGNELSIQHAISRYHAFLDLMASSPATFFVPTLDIDLVWHTHQLMADKYEADCTRYVSHFINHDDQIEGRELSSAFDSTCRAWKDRFFVQYTYCGCPIPRDTIGVKLVRFISGARYLVPPHLLPFKRPGLLSATHAGDHIAVHPQTKDPPVRKPVMPRYQMAPTGRQGPNGQKAAKKKDPDFSDVDLEPFFYCCQCGDGGDGGGCGGGGGGGCGGGGGGHGGGGGGGCGGGGGG